MHFIFEKELSSGANVVVQENTNLAAYFMEHFDLTDKQREEISTMNARRKKELLASRYLLEQAFKIDDIWERFYKDDFGKPHIRDYNRFISLSHSNTYCAAISHAETVGIDIQKHVEKISRIQHKFVSEKEALFLSNEPTERIMQLHIIWGAKESLYKAYGKKELDFRKHLQLDPFSVQQKSGSLSGSVIKNEYEKTFQIHYEVLHDYYLVYAVPISE